MEIHHFLIGGTSSSGCFSIVIRSFSGIFLSLQRGVHSTRTSRTWNPTGAPVSAAYGFCPKVLHFKGGKKAENLQNPTWSETKPLADAWSGWTFGPPPPEVLNWTFPPAARDSQGNPAFLWSKGPKNLVLHFTCEEIDSLKRYFWWFENHFGFWMGQKNIYWWICTVYIYICMHIYMF